MNVQGFLDTLHISGFGMLGIFFVIFIIYLAIVLLNKLFPGQ